LPDKGFDQFDPRSARSQQVYSSAIVGQPGGPRSGETNKGARFICRAQYLTM
jgi:hypothetical protein